MSTPNYRNQPLFDLYATEDTFLVYPYKLDENDDFLLDESGEYIIDYDAEPYFSEILFDECKRYADKLNAYLDFFNIDFKDGYWNGIQTYINPQTSEFDAIDFLQYPQDYSKKDLFAEFGVNSYILKLKILKEIKFINNKLLPELAKMYNFDKLVCAGVFSNGEAIYEKC